MRICAVITLVLLVAFPLLASSADEETGFVAMFNGKDLSGWEGKPGGWYVEDGALTAESTKENPCEKHHYLYWTGGEPADFILRFDYKITGEGGNSGVQFRSEKRPDYDAWGYQADIETSGQWTGCLFQHDRGGVVMRGNKAKISAQGEKEESAFAAPETLQACVNANDWNAYEISAEGNHITLSINGHRMCEVHDDDATYSRKKGFIALQMHPGPPMKIQFRNLRIKELGNNKLNMSFLQDCVFVSVDFQGDGKLEPLTEANLPAVWREMGFSVNDVNAARDFALKTALPNAVKVADACRALGLPRIFIHWGYLFEDAMDLDPEIRASMCKEYGTDYARYGGYIEQPESQPAAAFNIQRDDYVLPKAGRDAFDSSNIDFVLRNLETKNIVFVGGHTNAGGCLGKTARSAMKQGYKTLCIRDATFNARESTREQDIIDTKYSQVINTTEFLDVVRCL